MVFHQMGEFVALPFCPEGGVPGSDAINIVDMLSEQEGIVTLIEGGGKGLQ